MSEQLPHECGIAFIRLLKPIEYYVEKYGSPHFGLDKMSLLMEKQHNRGQDGAGLAVIKFDMPPGKEYIELLKSATSAPIIDVLEQSYQPIRQALTKHPEGRKDAQWLKQQVGAVGELLLGHLRYGTFGRNSIEYVQPFVRENNWMTRNLVMAGNFNLTNVDEIFKLLVNAGQHPIRTGDAHTLIEKMASCLDEENEELFRRFKDQGFSNLDISGLIAQHLDLHKVVQKATKRWDGAYAMMGALGHGDAFVLRDPNGIRPAYYYKTDEFIVAASERPVIQTAFNAFIEDIQEVPPGHMMLVKRNGEFSLTPFTTPAKEPRPCSFERIYFSRGTDADIYTERKSLGRMLTPAVLKAIHNDLEHTVFSFIPNTASVAFRGLSEGLNAFASDQRKEAILKLSKKPTVEELDKIFKIRPRIEAIAVKDTKMRTFITQDADRDDLVAHVYDVTYGQVKDHIDTLVMLDDSIVRGTTLRQSILRILDRLNPKKIIIVSSAPQIRYPDCYGIDMAKLGDFVVFQAAIALLKEQKKEKIIHEVYKKCKAQEHLMKEVMKNPVREIYKPFSSEEISHKVSQLLTPPHLKAEVEIIFQTIENLHLSCPNHQGDWYFTGKYPTPGGNKVVTRSFINYYENKDERAY